MENDVKKQIEKDLRSFTVKNFEAPSNCRNLEQIRFYIGELCRRIEVLESRFNYVPNSAYQLLAEYNAKQNSLIHYEFQKTYH